jgi:hypothetical protein
MDKPNKLDHMITKESVWRDLEQSLETLRQKRDQERNQVSKKHSSQAYWLRCPKCGGHMEPLQMDQIWVEKCQSCRGIYLDHGELELLSNAKNPAGFWSNLWSRLKKASSS